MTNNTFCPVPWMHLSSKTNGEARFCCNGTQGPNKGLLRKPDGSIYNFKTDNLVEMGNSQMMKDIRLAMLDDKWHDECYRCRIEEESGFKSRRHYELAEHNDYLNFETAKAMTNPDGSLTKPNNLSYLEFRFGNNCNLKCVMCYPSESSSWYDDYRKINNTDHFMDNGKKISLVDENGNTVKKIAEYDWSESTSFWEQLEANIPYLKKIYIAGGEPLMIKRHYDFLEKAIELGYAKDIVLNYNINGTLVNKKILDIWSHYNFVFIGLSLDGIGKFNEWIRFPTNWDQIVSKLELIENTPRNIHVAPATTLQLWNINHITDIYNYFIFESQFKKIQKVRMRPYINVHFLHSPHMHSIQAVPKKAKEMIVEKILQYSNNLPEPIDDIQEVNFPQLKKTLQNIVNFMNQQHTYSMYKGKILHFVDKIAEIRGTHFKYIDPELYQYLINEED